MRKRFPSSIPESKYCKRSELKQRSLPRQLDDAVQLWEEKFEEDIMSLFQEPLGDAYKVKIEGWRHNGSAQRSYCRVALVNGSSYATYGIFPFLNTAGVISPRKENATRILADPILASAGYKVIEHYDAIDKAA